MCLFRVGNGIKKQVFWKVFEFKQTICYTHTIKKQSEGNRMNIAYVRVSTVEQNEARQKEALANHGIERWFEEKVSAKDANRPKLQEMLEFARQGDTIYIHDFSRLARSTEDLLKIVKQLEDKGIHLVSNKENIDTSTPTGKLMLTMIGAINEFERTNLKERQAEGIAIAKENGVYKGRKEIERPDQWEEVYSKYKSRELTGTKAMEQLGLKRNTFYKLVDEETKMDEMIKELQPKINGYSSGTLFELPQLYGSLWDNVESKTTYGKLFKKLVDDGKIKGIKFKKIKSNNHAEYEKI